MQCEVCGHRIIGEPYKTTIEEAKMIVCGKCAKLGSISWEMQTPRRVKKLAKPKSPLTLTPKKKQSPKLAEEVELVNDFSSRVRLGREKMGINHEDLGKKIGEKVSVLRKIESGKMTPDYKLAAKLEHTLRVKLLVPPSEPKTPSARLSTPREATLGDLVRVKKKKKEVTEEREQL
jgi:putative transcription factor